MKFRSAKKAVVISAVVLFVGAVAAFAHGGYGRGYGGHMMGFGDHMMGYGPGHGRMWNDDDGPRMRGYGWNLSEEDAARLDAAREKFFNETRELRGQIDEKRLALRNELAQDEPDAGKVADLQKDLSNLQTEFDQKRVQHQLEMRKLMPKDARGRGYGPGYGRGGGYCWR